VLTTMAVALALSASVGVVSVSATTPSGQVMIGNTSYSTATGHFTGGGGTVEPAIDDANGNTVYLFTPNNAKTHANAHNFAPLYLVVYPVGSGIDPASLNCQHLLADLTTLHDNCIDHGLIVAGAASASPVYTDGVLGHDHLVGIASTGGDFNIIWEPVLVLFNSVDASKTRILTLDALNTAYGARQVSETPLPFLDFNCASVSAALFNSGTPAPVVGP
jgi:hypothetical protein